MTTTEDPRQARRRARQRQWLGWGGLAILVLLLLSLASGGLFLLAALVLAGVLSVALGSTAISVVGLGFERRLSDSEVPVGTVVEGSLRLHNRKPWPAHWLLWSDRIEAGLDVEGPTLAFESLPGEGSAELCYRVHTTRRGLYRLGPALAEAADPFGLVRRFHLADEATFLTVLPRTLAIGQGWPLGHKPIHQVPRRSSLFEDPSRFLGVREYRPGDPLKRIHWRASARSAALQVKLFEPAVLDGALLVLDAGTKAYRLGTGDEQVAELGDPRFELAVTTASSLADAVLGGNQAVGLLANGADAAERYPEDWQGGTFRRLDEVLDQAVVRRRLTAHRPLEVRASKGGEQQRRLALALARLEHADGPSLADMLHTELPRLPRSLVLLVITPRLDSALAAVLGELRRSGFELGVVWIGGGREAAPPTGLPERMPVWPVRGDADLERLGSLQL